MVMGFAQVQQDTWINRCLYCLPTTLSGVEGLVFHRAAVGLGVWTEVGFRWKQSVTGSYLQVTVGKRVNATQAGGPSYL